MTSEESLDDLIAQLEQSTTDTLAYFRSAGRDNPARLDDWGAWEVLVHFIHWHYATAWGIASAAVGGEPWRVSGDHNVINDACLRLHAGESFDELIAQLERAQERLVREARAATDLDAAAFSWPGIGLVSIRKRLQTIAQHWREHLEELQAAAD